MANFSIKIDLQKLKNAFVTNIPGKTTTKKCICIPIEDAHLYLGKQGTYLDITAIELHDKKYEDTHCLKQNFPKDVYEKFTENERKALPIIGGMHEMKKQQQVVDTTTKLQSTDDLPF